LQKANAVNELAVEQSKLATSQAEVGNLTSALSRLTARSEELKRGREDHKFVIDRRGEEVERLKSEAKGLRE
jgi:hypothetical protein